MDQQAVRVIDAMSLYLFILVVVLYGAAVLFAIDRRLALRDLGIAVVVGSAVLLVAQRVTIDIGVEQLARAESGRAAVDSIARIATGLLNELAWSWSAMGVVIVAYAILAIVFVALFITAVELLRRQIIREHPRQAAPVEPAPVES